MNNKYLPWAVVIVLLAILGWVWLGRGDDDINETTDDQATQHMTEDEEGKDVSGEIVSTWRSTTDTNFVREFRSDGTVTDLYEGETPVTSSGTWKLFTSTSPVDSFTAELDPEAVYVRMLVDGEAFHFSIAELDADSLSLVYLDRGGVLEFSRIEDKNDDILTEETDEDEVVEEEEKKDDAMMDDSDGSEDTATTTNESIVEDDGVLVGLLQNSDDSSQGNLMLVQADGTLYINTSRDFFDLVGKEVKVTIDGNFESFALIDIEEKVN